MKTNKINMFNCKKEFSVRVVEYMEKKVWSITLKKRLQVELDKLNQNIEAYKCLLGSVESESAQKLIDLTNQKIADVSKEYADLMEKQAKFEWNDADNAFYKTYVEKGTRDAVIEFCKSYGLDVKNTDLLAELEKVIGGGRRASAGVIVRSDAKTFTSDTRSKGDVLGIMYGRLAEKMIQAGTIKPAQIPEDIRAAYAPKKSATTK